MERLQGPINPCHFFGDHLDLQCLEQGMANITAESLRYEEEEGTQYLSMPGLEDTVPFLQMLQNVDCPPFSFPMKEPSFQALLKLQHVKTAPWSQMQNTQIQTLEALESCVTQDNQQIYSPVKSEGKDHHQNPHSVSDCNQDLKPNSAEMGHDDQTQYTKSAQATRERKKRKRTRPAKNKEEVESQRMTHIAVERNRRKQMNDHLSVLRSLMPPSYIQRGDQASIVGGAIDFVKELEQHLQSLEAQKRMRKGEGNGDHSNDNPSSSSSPSSSYIACPPNGMFMSMSQCRIGSIEELGNNSTFRDDGTLTAQNKSEAATVYATVIQSHVNLKVQCKRRPSQLMRAIAALEDLRLTVLHLNINSSEDMILYSFNLKIEEACNLGSADEIAIAVQQIFSFINNN